MDELSRSLTGITLPSTLSSSGNQFFIVFTSNGNGVGKGFSASFTIGKKIGEKKCILNFCNFFFPLKENICDNALDLANAQLIFEGGHCWL